VQSAGEAGGLSFSVTAAYGVFDNLRDRFVLTEHQVEGAYDRTRRLEEDREKSAPIATALETFPCDDHASPRARPWRGRENGVF
jgi:hypothetical protein